MGGLCSRSSIPHNTLSHAGGPVDYYGAGRKVYLSNEFKSNAPSEIKSSELSSFTPSQVRESTQKQPQEESQQIKEPSSFHETGTMVYGSNEDDFYDGIPRFPRALSLKSRSIRSKQAAVAKVSEVSSRLGKAGTLGIGKAVNVLDTLGSSMSSLNQSSGFISAVTTKGNDLQILAFEVANTIVKGSSLLQSLSKRSIRQLKEVVLASEGVQRLVSRDINELLAVVANDKREELKIFSGEVIRFGNRCRDSQWHNLDRYFEKRSKERAPRKQWQEEAEQMMEELMTLVQCTAELYHELQALDRLEQDDLRKHQEGENLFMAQRGNNLAISRSDVKNRRKVVRNLKKKSLWSRSLEEVMEKLVDIVLFLNWEMVNVFSNTDGYESSRGFQGNQQRLGPAGLDLHYANVVIQIDSIVVRCNSMPSTLRDTLYQSLPPRMKSSLRSKLQSFHPKEVLTTKEIKEEMEKTLHWLVPIAINTAKAHHGFGWVGEWANTGSTLNRKPAGTIDVMRIETFHYADKHKTEAYIVELVLWLNHLIKQSKVVATNEGESKSTIQCPSHTTPPQANQHPMQLAINVPSAKVGSEDQETLRDISNKAGTQGLNKSQDFDSTKSRPENHEAAQV